DIGPALGQDESQPRLRIRAGRAAHGGARHQVVAAQDGPVGRHAGVVAAARAAVVHLVAIAQPRRLAGRRRPLHVVAVPDHLAVTVDARIARLGHAQAHVPYLAAARLQADGHVRLALGGQEADDVLDVVLGAGLGG